MFIIIRVIQNGNYPTFRKTTFIVVPLSMKPGLIGLGLLHIFEGSGCWSGDQQRH